MITDKVDTIMQYGVASARIEEKIELMKLGPDMMAVAFNALIRLIERRAAVWQVGSRAGRDRVAPVVVGQAA